MDILGIGPLELVVILIVALAVFGPDRLPEIGAKLGRAMRQMRRATREFSREIEKARQAIDPDQSLTEPLQQIGGAVKDATAIAQAARNPGLALRDSVMRELKPDASAATERAAEISSAPAAESPTDQDRRTVAPTAAEDQGSPTAIGTPAGEANSAAPQLQPEN